MTLSSLFKTLAFVAIMSFPMANAGALAAPTVSDYGAGLAQEREEPPANGEAPVLLAQGNCSAAAAQAAADTGGQVLSVSSRNEGGRTVCVVTVLVPGKDGGRPRRTTVTVPG